MKSNHRDDDFDDDMPRRRGSNGIATAAMVLGMLSLILTVFAGIPAIICGAIGLARVKETGTGKSTALAGLILGIVGCLVCPFALIGVGLLLPAVSKVREAASRMNDSNHFKETALATYGYEEKMGEFPRPFFKDQKMTNENLSWRVALLNYAEQPSKYDLSFNYAKAWDSPENQKPSNQLIDMYVSKSDPPGTTQTRIQGFVGPGTMFDPTVPSVKFQMVTDGTSNTILFAESRTLVPWAAPQDMPYSANGPLPQLGNPTRPGFIVCMADGSVKFVKNTVNPAVLRGYITRNDGIVPQPLD